MLLHLRSVERRAMQDPSSPLKRPAMKRNPTKKIAPGMGHRARLWDRFAETGLRRGFPKPYEKLELLLTLALPRVDTKPLAKVLIAKFGSLNAVLAAPRHQLLAVEGIGARTALVLHCLREVALAMDEEYLAGRDLLSEPEAVRAFLRRELAWEEAEYLAALFLDARGRLIRQGRVFRGTLDQVPTYPRELVKEALAVNAAGVILIHNHPSGKTDPSHQDVQATKSVAKALRTVGIQLHDHLIVGKEAVTSLHEAGLYRQ